MNIFYLDHDIVLCAQYHYDTHVIKMILESTQILCTVLHQNNIAAPYRATHARHPCVIWAGASLDNWLWLRELVRSLNQEYQFRFDHTSPHRSFIVAEQLPLPDLTASGITDRPLVMPDQYKVLGDPLNSYRKFYADAKKHLLRYTKRSCPEWINQIQQH